MSRKPVQTFHLLSVAKSLEAQNEALAFYMGKIEMLAMFRDQIPENLRPMIDELQAETARVRAMLWPQGD